MGRKRERGREKGEGSGQGIWSRIRSKELGDEDVLSWFGRVANLWRGVGK